MQAKTDVGKVTDQVKLIDWEHPQENDFAIAEEVTLKGNYERRPDLVLYVNGITIAVIELKCSRVSIGDGIGQLLSNQEPCSIHGSSRPVNSSLPGATQRDCSTEPSARRKVLLKWKEDEQENSRFKLDKYLLKMCNKERLLELIHDYVLFDGGIKKVPRVHQCVGITAAQDHVRQRQGGIIWHTQGSGKSIVMGLLAKWILENNPNARVAIITDR